jgi:hypothetical protein
MTGWVFYLVVILSGTKDLAKPLLRLPGRRSFANGLRMTSGMLEAHVFPCRHAGHLSSGLHPSNHYLPLAMMTA